MSDYVKSSVVKCFHPSSERLCLYVKAQRTDAGTAIVWAYLDKKNDAGHWSREWLDLREHPPTGTAKERTFWQLISAHGFDEEETRMTISDYLDNDQKGPL